MNVPAVFYELLTEIAPAYAERISAELNPELPDGFRLADTSSGRVSLQAANPVALAAGLHWFLRERAGFHRSWGGDHAVVFPELPAVGGEVEQRFALPLRPYLNYCTFGYSMVWYDWERWRREIDFMALSGINMPLAVTGVEVVWLRTFLRFGLSKEEVLAFLSGPAFLPWQLMNNLNGHVGPMPETWIESHLALGKQILERERAWGMKPILPGYNGQVPDAFARRYPQVRYFHSEGWCGFAPVTTIDPADPMLAEVNKVFLEELIQAFGTDHYYSIDLFHEQRLKDNSPEYLSACGAGVANALLEADPDAIWVMQAWSERADIIKAIPEGRLLLLDIGKERLRDTNGLYGVPTVWGTIHSFGGQTEIGGELAAIPQTIAERRREFSNLVGAGAFPESIDNNPVLFELVFDSALCGGELSLKKWLAGYLKRRYGAEARGATQAWQLLLRDVYTQRRGDPVFAARPALNPDRANAWAGFHPDDIPLRFFPAWEKLLLSASLLRESDGYRFDVIDLGRQALSALGRPFLARCRERFAARDLPGFQQASAAYLELMRDCDTMLGSRREFRLDFWIAAARRWGHTPAEKAYYEKNARLLTTLWGPEEKPEPLFDYCCREWNGLLADYYLVRWRMFFSFLENELKAGRDYDDADLPRLEGRIQLEANSFYRDLYQFERSFAARESKDVEPVTAGDELALAERYFEKYAPLVLTPGAEVLLSSSRGASEVLAGFAGQELVTL